MKINLITAHLLFRKEPNDDDHLAAEIATQLIRAYPKSVLSEPDQMSDFLIRIFMRVEDGLNEVSQDEAADNGVRVVRVSLKQSTHTDNWCFIHITQPCGPVEPVAPPNRALPGAVR